MIHPRDEVADARLKVGPRWRGHEPRRPDGKFTYGSCPTLSDHHLNLADVTGVGALCWSAADERALELRQLGSREPAALRYPVERNVSHGHKVEDLAHREAGGALVVGGQNGLKWLAGPLKSPGALCLPTQRRASKQLGVGELSRSAV